MGSMIHLAVGKLEVDWGKNSGFTDHGPLFQVTDLKDVPYYYASDTEDEVIAELHEGLSKPLIEVVDRLDLLGHTYGQIDKELAYVSELSGHDLRTFGRPEMEAMLASVDVSSIASNYGDGGEDFGKFFRRELAPRLGAESFANEGFDLYSASHAFENLSTYAILHMLARNPLARNLPVNWQFHDVEEGGWASRDTLVRPLEPQHRFLVVTEGSTDSTILKHALQLFRPNVADFFDFVDMEEGYPFSGTGNVYKFVQGLVSISVQNNVLVVFDNDAEGVFNYNRCQKLNLPRNMRVLKLPELADFENFPTIGPQGETTANINSRAAAMECYLPLDSAARVRWTSYQKSLGTYQGELEQKGDYMKSFLNLKQRSTGDYRKIEAVIEDLIRNAVGMKEAEVEAMWTEA